MTKRSEQIGYLRGLLRSGEPDAQRLTEILSGMLDVFEAQLEFDDKLEDQLNDLDEYVESIDDDLAEVEEVLDDINGELFPVDDVDEDDEDEAPRAHSLHLVRGGEDHPRHAHFHHDDDDDDDDDEEADDDALLKGLFLGAMCPECHRLFCVDDADFDDPDARYRCPYCGKDVRIVPIDPQHVPLAVRVDQPKE